MKLLTVEEFAAGEGGKCQPLLAAFARHAPGAIRNVSTRMSILATGTHFFPVSINTGDERIGNSYVVSPYTTYTGYAQYEIAQLGAACLTWPLRMLVKAVGLGLTAARVDQLVQVNNWLLSTNLYPANWEGADLPEMTDLLTREFPEHAISFRSLNQFSNAKLIGRLENLGYLALPSRQVYLFDARKGEQSEFWHCRDNHNDARLSRNTSYEIVPGNALADTDYARLEHLYNLLYLEKYSPLNPQFSADWLRAGQRDGWLELRALRSEEGRMDGVAGWFGNSHIFTTPIVGYDTALPQKLGLYRLITHLSLQEAAQRRCLFNGSAGAARFKRLRGGVPAIEYSLVFVRHLPVARQQAWRSLVRLLRGIGVPLMQKFRL
ncbi:MAG: hypothetical protein LBV44_04690 [Methylobacillus sp.]|nr:hypothetical protein [Methylobacillus sp.]